MASSRKVAEERSIGETLVRDFVQADVADTSASLTSSQHLLRLLNEVQDDLARHAAGAYSGALQGSQDPERLAAVLAVSSAVAEARVRVADACYSELDVTVNALDRRLKLMEAVLKLHGQTLGEEGALGVEERMAELTRPPDAVSSRMRKREPPAGAAAGGGEEGGGGGGSSSGGGGGGGSSSSSGGGAGSLKQQLAAVTGGGGAPGLGTSPGALDVAIGSFEPHYCELNAGVLLRPLALPCAPLLRSLTTPTFPHHPRPFTPLPTRTFHAGLCQQVAFGEMVACDNDGCKIEWFHMACVGLSAATRPTSKWYCTACRGGAR